MRIFTILLALCVYTISYAQITLPIDFESTTINYTFGDFAGGSLSVVDNPDQSMGNMSDKVAQMVRDGGEVFAGSSITLESAIDFSNKLFRAKVWVPNAGDKVLLKVENGMDGGIFHQRVVFPSTAGEWQTVEFDFTGIDASRSYEKIVLIFDEGEVGDGSANSTYFIDDIELVAVTGNRPTIPMDFEDNNTDWVFGDFDGGVLTREANPDQSGINTSGNVIKMVKNTGAPFAGSSIQLPGGIDFSTEKFFRMKAWTPNAGDRILLKFENSGVAGPGVPPIEVETATMAAQTWETIEFDFSNVNPAFIYDKIVIICDLNDVGDGSADFTYYMDDIEQFEGVSAPKPDLPITFEDGMIDYNLVDFGGNASSIVVDPTDPNNMVGQAVRTAGAVTFAGTVVGDNGLENPVPFTASETKMNVRIWSPEAGIPCRLKIENTANGGIFVETETSTSVAMQWETVEFDFSNPVVGSPNLNPAETYNKVIIFFNFGAEGATVGEQTYFWDDIAFGEVSTSVETLNAADFGIKVSPNPAANFFQLEIPESISADMDYTLFDITGKMLRNSPVQGKVSQINTADLNPGTYFLNLRTQDAIYVQKVMVVK